MPAERFTKRKTGSAGHPSNNVEPCIVCGKVVSRASDIPRHMKMHDSDAMKLPCTWEGCDYSTLQKSNLETHIRRHTQDRPYLCKDDPACNFQTCDPASLHRHRKRLHGYIPKSSSGRKTTRRGRKASIDSSSSIASPFAVESSWGSSSPTSTSPSSSTSCLSPSYSSPLGESESTSSILETPSNSPSHQTESLLFTDSLPNYAWDTPLLPELDFPTAESETKQSEFQYPRQDHQKESQAQPKVFLHPLQLPNMERVFPGYGTTGQLHGLSGLDFGLEQQPQQAPSPEVVNNDTWFDLSVNGSPILQHRSLPVESFQAPIAINYTSEICSPVQTGNLELDMEVTSGLGLNIRFDSSTPENTDFSQMTSSSCDLNSVFFNLTHPSPNLVDIAAFTDGTNAQLHLPSDSNLNDEVNLQTHFNPSFINLSASGLGCFDHSQLTDVNGEVNLSLRRANDDANASFIDLLASGLDYFDQCRWDFGFEPTSHAVDGPLSSGLENALMFYS